MSQDFSINVPSPLLVTPTNKQVSTPPASIPPNPAPTVNSSPEPVSSDTLKEQQTPDAASAPVVEEIYGKLPITPVMEAVDGIRFDFNEGIRVQFPLSGGPWHIVFRDMDTGVILYSQDATPGAYITSVKKFYVRFKLEIFLKSDLEAFAATIKKKAYFTADEDNNPKPIFSHEYNAKGKTVMIQMPVPTIGDTIAWFPYIEKFRVKHNCHVLAVLLPHLADLLKKQYPEITFITKEEVPSCEPYACYYLGLFFRGDVDHQPSDFRFVGLHKTAGYILGVDPSEEVIRFDLSAPRTIPDRYVCLAIQSSSQAKYWNNPQGWHDVVKFLRDAGYRVLCMDRDRVYGQGLVWNHIPNGCEDFTGNLPLQERINIIKDADFFIGVSSGLSWLAWGCRVPVVMISGFTHPTNEFDNPYRVINYHTCNSCWNDMRIDFDHFDYLWCPRHKGTERQFECTRLITSEQVINTIKTIPAYQDMANKL